MVVGSGESARIELVDDHATQLRAADAVLDRVYGKAKAAVEVSRSGDDDFDKLSLAEMDTFLAEADEGLRRQLEEESRGKSGEE